MGYKYLSQEKIVNDIINTISEAKTKTTKEKDKTDTETEMDGAKTGLMRYNKSKSTKSTKSKSSKNK